MGQVKIDQLEYERVDVESENEDADVQEFHDNKPLLPAVTDKSFDYTPGDTYNESFGIIDTWAEPPKIPFDNDNPSNGIDLRTALHYLDGDKTGTKITSKVTNVIFGLNEKYPGVVDQYDGTLVDVEQDVSVYAYYVPNGTNYDVYFLANDAIYTPKNSNTLFMDMTALKTVDTTNMDVSRTESMSEMFRNCTALTEMDVSQWDTGNSTTMKNMFRNCKVLSEIDVSDWDTSKVTDMAAMFREAKAVAVLDTAKWDVSNVKNFAQTFAICDNLQIVNTSNWDTSGATSFSWTFYECRKLHTLDASNWDISNVTDIAYMFDNCKQLATLDVSNWDTSNVTTMDHWFASRSQNAGDMKITKLDVGNWDTSNVTLMNSMFYGCGSLTELDLGSWDVSKVTTMTHMFADCFNLKDLNLYGWDTSSLVVMDAMFNDCHALETLDVSTFKTQNVKEFSQVFEACVNLKTIIGLKNWDTSGGCSFQEMFSGCKSLKELDLSSFDTGNARDNFKGQADTYHAFISMFSGVTGLEKLILGANFDFNGNSDSNSPVSLPSPAAIDGQAASWYNEANGTYYAAGEIPEKTAATYIAAVKP